MTAIELFGCAGGMALGFRRAGIEFDWAFDWDADACASYEVNLGHRPVQMDARDVLRLVESGWRPAARPGSISSWRNREPERGSDAMAPLTPTGGVPEAAGASRWVRGT